MVGGGLACDDIGRIAALTLDAAAPALEKSTSDAGLRQTFYLLTQIALAARQPDWQVRLARAGISLGEDASLFDLTAGLQTAIDRHTRARGVTSDVGEIAQQAAGEALTLLAQNSATTLFGSGGQHLQLAVRELSTSAGFARLGQVFFGRFLSRFLGFYLDRVVARATGTDRVPSVAEASRFSSALQKHCEESARIVRDFCGQWYSSTEHKEGIGTGNTSRFMAVALRKLSDELTQQRAEA
jgi:hypothetical protein